MSLNSVDVVILCGGMGTRLQSVVSDKPKVMAQVDGRPFLDIWIEHLRDCGFQRFVLCTGHKADVIKDYYQKNFQELEFQFSKETQPLGTGGAVKNAQGCVKSDQFFVLNGDAFCPLDFQKFFEYHIKEDSIATLSVTCVKEGEDFGGITLDKQNRLVAFKEKEKGSKDAFVNVGAYCFSKDIFDVMPDEDKFSLEYDFFPKLKDKQAFGFMVDQKFWDIGTPERYKAAQEALHKERNK